MLAVMYVDDVPNRNSRPAVLLRESRRLGKKTVKRTVANMSNNSVIAGIINIREPAGNHSPPTLAKI
jgi:hypothetical protein